MRNYIVRDCGKKDTPIIAKGQTPPYSNVGPLIPDRFRLYEIHNTTGMRTIYVVRKES
ncbi:MAG: hypothetical protein U9Q21_03280 [Candidatus Auribacterota bacterium]|nr:hypothetical protein [Candidatus Auribacterota bacterium]